MIFINFKIIVMATNGGAKIWTNYGLILTSRAILHFRKIVIGGSIKIIKQFAIFSSLWIYIFTL